MKFIVLGKFKMGQNMSQPFKKEVTAENKDEAMRKTICLLGSKHHCPKRFIKIEKVEVLNE